MQLAKFFDLKKIDELIGKRLKISFTLNDTNDDSAEGNLSPQIIFHIVQTFRLDVDSLDFLIQTPSSESLYVTVYSSGEFELILTGQGGSSNDFFSDKKVRAPRGMIRAKIQLI
ncbi:MAG: hypothetical protein JWM20_723 [Patescibacteria group bacterium]|nr:hypothetical protein [Patescibacteria group bacterium]